MILLRPLTVLNSSAIVCLCVKKQTSEWTQALSAKWTEHTTFWIWQRETGLGRSSGKKEHSPNFVTQFSSYNFPFAHLPPLPTLCIPFFPPQPHPLPSPHSSSPSFHIRLHCMHSCPPFMISILLPPPDFRSWIHLSLVSSYPTVPPHLSTSYLPSSPWV